MAPKPLRQQTRKSASALPTTQTAQFLIHAAENFSVVCPQMAAVLGRRCLLAACGQHGALSRQEASSLCKHCGAVLPQPSPDTAKAVKLSRSASRRNRLKTKKNQMAGKSQNSQSNRAALIIPCVLCGHTAVKQFYTLEAARQAAQIPPDGS